MEACSHKGNRVDWTLETNGSDGSGFQRSDEAHGLYEMHGHELCLFVDFTKPFVEISLEIRSQLNDRITNWMTRHTSAIKHRLTNTHAPIMLATTNMKELTAYSKSSPYS